jgi:ABC-type sugar transport system ATPase subunit
VVAITLDGVTVRYAERSGDRVDALDDLNLDIATGELLVLAGPSGSGKTTVLRTIAGLEEPVRGTVRIDGVVVNGTAPGQRDVALVSQYDSLFPHFDVEQNLGFALQLRKLPADETARRVHAEARVLGLVTKLRRRPKELSSGERQKAALGRATTRRPRVYLLDEPLAGLDQGERARVRRELRGLQRGFGVTTVYVTHDQHDAMALGDRVAILDRGRLVQVADPLTLYRMPANLFVATFVGTPPMGVLRGRFHDDGSTAWIDVGGTALRLLPAQRAAVASQTHGDTLVLGMRASAVALDHDVQHEWSRHLDVVVRGIEPLGSATVLMFAPAGTVAASPELLYAMVRPTEHHMRGQRRQVTVDMRECFLFDGVSGRRLSAGRNPYAE